MITSLPRYVCSTTLSYFPSVKIIHQLIYISYFQEEDIRKSIEESHRLHEEYQKYVDLEIVNDDFDKTFRTIMESLNKLATESQWVPLNWVYS